MRPIMLVFLGGGVGACLRYLAGMWIPADWASPLPLSTLLVNLVGAAALGAVATLADEAGVLSARSRLLLAYTPGLLGGFTTWSSFMVGTVSLITGRHLTVALAYLVLSLGGGPLCVVAGAAAARRLVRQTRPEPGGEERSPRGGPPSPTQAAG
ncbi:MAG: fluoride efflux transporter CrcB [Chloroflexota bacterium]